MDTKTKNTIPFIIAHKHETFPFKSNNVQYSYAKNNKILMNEIKDPKK